MTVPKKTTAFCIALLLVCSLTMEMIAAHDIGYGVIGRNKNPGHNAQSPTKIGMIEAAGLKHIAAGAKLHLKTTSPRFSIRRSLVLVLIRPVDTLERYHDRKFV